MTWLYPCTSNVIFVKIQLFDFVCKRNSCFVVVVIKCKVLGHEFVNKSKDNKLPSEVHDLCAHLDRH